MKPNSTLRNVADPGDLGGITGKSFPCPVCGCGVPINLTYKGKPYCTCNDCGLQLFFRGKIGIKRLQQLLCSAKFICGDQGLASDPLALVNRLEKLKDQKRELESKQGLIFKNEPVDNAIIFVNKEISKIEKTLKKIAGKEDIKK